MNTDPLPLAFEQFKRDRASAFERIARRTRGSHDADDLKSEAWFIAREIGQRRNCRVDLFNRVEQEQVLAWLYKRFVDYVGGKLKESIDQEPEEASRSWQDRLTAPEEANPLDQLLRLDEDTATELPTKGFSQFSAYMILLRRCEMKPLQLALYLSISFTVLRKRIWSAFDAAERQPSLFDSVSSVDPNFEPRGHWLRRLWARWFGSQLPTDPASPMSSESELQQLDALAGSS